MLSATPGKRLNKYIPDYVVFDLETTGISVAWDAVIEISAIKVAGGGSVDEFTTLVNPGRPIPFGASSVNGIYDDMVKDSPGFEKALGNFLEFAGDAVLVGHNIHTFDMKFLMRDAEKYWGRTVGNDYIDTLALARQYLPQLSRYRLVDLAGYYRIPAEGAHRALNDCRMNQQVYERLGSEMNRQAHERLGSGMKNAATLTGKYKMCPRCGQVLRKRNGRYGEFWGCSGFPECRYTEEL